MSAGEGLRQDAGTPEADAAPDRTDGHSSTDDHSSGAAGTRDLTSTAAAPADAPVGSRSFAPAREPLPQPAAGPPPLPFAAEKPAPPAESAAAPGGAGLRRSRVPLRSWSNRRLASVTAAIVLLSALSAYLVNAAQPTLYGAEADVLFEVAGSAQEGERDLATQEVLLSSRRVLAPVAERFDVPLRDLARAQEVELIAGSEVLRMRVRNRDPALAVRLAQGIAVTYVQSVTADVGDGGVDQQRRIRDEIANLSVTAAAGRARLDALAEARAEAGGQVAVTREERELQVQDAALAQRLSALEGQLTEILVEQENMTRASVLTDAYLLDDPVAPKPLRGLAAGVMLGLVLGSALVALVVRQRSLPAQP